MTAGRMFEDIERQRPTRGGGGRPRIRIGKTGPRGRRYAVVKQPSGSKAIVKSSYAKRSSDSNRHIKAHLKYIQQRERGGGEKERTFFDRQLQNIERWEVERIMLQNKGSRAGHDYMHRERSVDRAIDRALERELGQDFDKTKERDKIFPWNTGIPRSRAPEVTRTQDHDRDRDEDEERRRERDRERDDFFGR